MKHLQTLLEHNTLSHFLIAGVTTIIIFAFLAGLYYFISSRISKIVRQTNTYWDSILVDAASSTRIFILITISILLGLLTLNMSDELRFILVHVALVIFAYQCGLWLSKAISRWAFYRSHTLRGPDDEPDSNNYAILSFVLRLAVWVVVLLLVLDNLGVNVTTLVASLGIGGVAIALAVQNILGDLFSSLSIALDKPFMVGDFIVVDNLSGTVKNIGLKTTRLTSLTGEELVFSNTDLLKSRIHNYKKMEVRRIVFSLGITFDTPPAKLRLIPGMITDIFQNLSYEVRLDRVHFSKIGTSSLDFEIVYYVNIADYNVYMDVQQTLNLAIMEQFAAEKIEFAFPTQTVHINNEK